jgi:hypothetical protein
MPARSPFQWRKLPGTHGLCTKTFFLVNLGAPRGAESAVSELAMLISNTTLGKLGYTAHCFIGQWYLVSQIGKLSNIES